MSRTKRNSASEKQLTCFDTFSVKKVGSDVYVEGWANKAIVDRGKDIIKMDAWDLENYKKVPMILFNHDKDMPIGKAVDVRATEAGLWIKAKLSKSNHPEVSRIRDFVQEGILNAFSVGFDSQDEEKDGEGINNIKRAELYEVSIVTLPMNQDSVFAVSSKSLAAMTRDEAAVELLRAKGASVAADLHAKICELEKQGKRRDAILKSVAEAGSVGLDQLTQILAGNVLSVPESVVTAFETVFKQDKEMKMKPDGTPDMEGPGYKGINVGVMALLFPKEAAASADEAAQMAVDHGYEPFGVEETEAGWVVQLEDPAMFVDGQQSQVDIGDGVVALVGVKKPDQEGGEAEPEQEGEQEPGDMEPKAADDKADPKAEAEQFAAERQATEEGGEGNPASWVADEALWEKAKRASEAALGKVDYAFVVWWYLQNGGSKKSAESNTEEKAAQDGTPIPSSGDGSIETEGNPYIEQARQTNVLLGQLIQEIRGMSAKLDGMVEMHDQEMGGEQEMAAAPCDPEEEAQKQVLIENLANTVAKLTERMKKLGA